MPSRGLIAVGAVAVGASVWLFLSRRGKLRIVTSARLGRYYVAARAFAPGEIVLSEEPLLQTTPSGSTASRTELCLRAFCLANPSVQSKVLSHFFSPLEDVDASTVHSFVRMREMLNNVDFVQHRDFAAEPWARAHSRDTLRRVMLAFELNAHSFVDGASALFERGCLFAHSCDANTRYMPCGRHGVHISTRPIAKGEPVTSNYLSELAALSRPMREHLLDAQKLFLCECARCRGPDWTRQVPCPHCHPRLDGATLPSMPDETDAFVEHSCTLAYVVPRPGDALGCAGELGGECGGECAGERGGVTEAAWSCIRCGRSWSDRELQRGTDGVAPVGAAPAGVVPLREYAQGTAAFRFLFEWVPEYAPSRFAELRRRYTTAAKRLGARHWATARLAELQLQVLGDALRAAIEQLEAESAARRARLQQLTMATLGIEDENPLQPPPVAEGVARSAHHRRQLTLATLGMDAVHAASEMSAYSRLIWQFCAAGFVDVCAFLGALAGPPLAALLGLIAKSQEKGAAPGSVCAGPTLLPDDAIDELLLRGLACAACVLRPHPVHEDALVCVCDTYEVRTGRASHGTAASIALAHRAGVAMAGGAFDEALLYYRSALFGASTKDGQGDGERALGLSLACTIHDRMAECYRELGLHEEAARAFRHACL